jgi:hypothetical protein
MAPNILTSFQAASGPELTGCDKTIRVDLAGTMLVATAAESDQKAPPSLRLTLTSANDQ